MSKKYADYMNEITSDELYKGMLSHGLFCEKLPPVLSTVPFYNYCLKYKTQFEDKARQYISFSSMRNINVPRQFGIPNPFAYQELCRCLADNWATIKSHFEDKTKNQIFKVSRIHIRKMSDTEALFEMNYNNWRVDDSPEPDMLIGARFLVKADIATFFPSIYTHSLAWALVGKEMSKSDRKRGKWFNEIDHFTQQTKDGETHGLLIGPHVSNLLSEIILTCIDYELVQQGWKYIRNIDDYSCYVASYEEGQKFLVELNKQLKNFNLLLNHKKTEVLELPKAAVEQWVRQINSACNFPKIEQMDYKDVRAFIDNAVELMQDNKNNAAILNYAIKVLQHKKLTDNAKQYCVKTFIHLAFIFPYLMPLLENNIFIPFGAKGIDIATFARLLFAESIMQRNYEATYYATYFAIKWDFDLEELTAEKAIDSQDCIVMLFAFKYFEKYDDRDSIKKLKDYAKSIKVNDFDSNWLFIYEILPKSDLTGQWKLLKEAGITFLTI